jgi:surfeit locus 1 family protein
MLRFIVRPRWLFLLAITLVISATCVRLGIWQLHRLHQRRAYNAAVNAGMAQPPVDLASLLPAGGPAPTVASVRYRRVTVTGSYDTVHEVVLYGRALDGNPGNHVLTPLILADGRAVIVDRGWVPYEMSTPPVSAAAPPTGTIQVTGILEPTDPAGTAGPSSGPATTMTTVDVPKLTTQVPYPLVPLYVWLQSQTPPQPGNAPAPAPLPPLDEGPHQSYMFQWFAFATIFLVGYGVLVGREAQDRRRATAG